MAFAIMRISKIKALSTFAAVERHGTNRDLLKRRTRPEKSTENRFITHKYMDPAMSLVERFKARTEGIKYRKDAVLGYEVILAYSPDAVVPEREWILANAKWLAASFGGAENVLSLRYDVDEKTPHLHAVICPRVGDKLCAKKFTGGKVALSKLQDTYADAMEPFGLVRGNKYLDCPEKASSYHKELREYYASNDKSYEAIVKEVFGDDISR